jgi:hypothetical protein
MMMLLILILLQLLSFNNVIGDVRNISISINCDNHCQLFINGIYQLENYDWSQYSIVNTTINLDNDVIGVNLVSWSGIIAFRSVLDFYDINKQYGINTANCKCINSKPYSNWNEIDFDDSLWPSAISYGNGNDIWGNVGFLNTSADWISSNDIAGNNVLCRCKPLSLHDSNECLTETIETKLSNSIENKLLVVIPGFGKPELDLKIKILKENLKRLKSSSETTFSSIRFHIFQYDMEFDMPLDIVNDPMVTITKEVGILGQFLNKHVTPSYVNQYDYILILLDDVEIIDVSWSELIMMKKLLKYNITSCCLQEGVMSFWSFTKHLSDKNIWIREQSMCELFCYLMDSNTYEKYYQFIDYDNPWMWGMDMIIESKMNLNCAVFNKFIANHYIRGGHTNSDASHDMKKYLTKYNTTWIKEENKVKIKRIITLP